MASYTWNGPAGGDWNTVSDWTPNGVPGAYDNAAFATGGNTYTVTGDASAASISVDADDVTFAGSLTIYSLAGLVGTDSAEVDVASTAVLADHGQINFAAGTLLAVDGELKTAGGVIDVAVVSGAGAQWYDGGSLALNQLYVTQNGFFTGNIITLNDGGTVNVDTSAAFSASTIDLAGSGTIYLANASQTPAYPNYFYESLNVTAGYVLSLATDPDVAAVFVGGIAGAGSVAITSGDVTFASPDTYTGGTNVLDAALTLVGAGAAGTGAIFLDDGSLTLQADNTEAAGSETVVAASGNNTVDDTVSASSGSLLVFGSASGTLAFTGGADNATVVGGAGGVLLATGGSGSDAIYGSSSGQDVLTTGPGPTTLAGAFGGLLTALGGAANTLVAAGGNTTLSGATATGNNVFYTSGTGTTVVQAGSGASTVVASGATNSIFGASGTQDVFLSGSGVTQLDFVSSFEGGTNNILGFDAADSLHLEGYAAGAAQAAVASETVAGGNTIIALSDNTQIVLFGYTGVTAATFT